jgi:NAD(P)-dependent dehydrogenase (short-subunit alcohol dehydrogenase family)
MANAKAGTYIGVIVSDTSAAATGMLANKVVVIIGGTSGLGLSATKACVRAGARVVAVGLPGEDAVALEDTILENDCVVATGDARDPATAESAIAGALEHFGGFHALYHVAGGSGRAHGDGPLDQVSDDGWDFSIDLNLTTVFYGNRAAARQFLKQGAGGCVLNIASVLAFAPSPTYFATHAYAAAKAGIIGMTRAAAACYAPKNIRFNVIAPALVDTPMAARAAHDPTIQKFIATKQPLDGGRIGRADDLDAAVVFLLSDAAKFVTGQVLSVDGGWGVSEGQVRP